MVELSTADEANVQGNEAFANQMIDNAIEVLVLPSANSFPVLIKIPDDGFSTPLPLLPPLCPYCCSSIAGLSIYLSIFTSIFLFLPNFTCVLLDAPPLNPHNSICYAARTAVLGWIAPEVASGRKATSCDLFEP